MRTIVAAVLLGLAAVAATAAPSSPATACTAIPGWEQVLAKPSLHWIVIGELHGTEETPAIFGDAACLTAQARGAVVVALEMPTTDQSRIDAFIGSDGGSAAQAEFLKAALWQGSMKDGRSSQAILRLFERLRLMHAAGQVSRVVAFQDTVRGDDPPGDQGPYEARMAATLRGAAAPGAMVVALVGNLHAMKTEAGFGKRFMPMASHLPEGQALTLNATGNGGAAWNCAGPGPAACGAHEFPANGEPRSRGVELKPVMDGAYDGVLNLGGPMTASPPQPTA
jgi:hypothetical protein